MQPAGDTGKGNMASNGEGKSSWSWNSPKTWVSGMSGWKIFSPLRFIIQSITNLLNRTPPDEKVKVLETLQAAVDTGKQKAEKEAAEEPAKGTPTQAAEPAVQENVPISSPSAGADKAAQPSVAAKLEKSQPQLNRVAEEPSAGQGSAQPLLTPGGNVAVEANGKPLPAAQGGIEGGKSVEALQKRDSGEFGDAREEVRSNGDTRRAPSLPAEDELQASPSRFSLGALAEKAANVVREGKAELDKQEPGWGQGAVIADTIGNLGEATIGKGFGFKRLAKNIAPAASGPAAPAASPTAS
eukprot:g16895.t1